MRVFAAPNGSGKTTVFEGVSDRFFIGIYVNADRIENEIAETGAVDLRAFKITQGVSGVRDTLQRMVRQWEGAGKQAAAALEVSRGPVVQVATLDSQYVAAVVADLIRRCLFEEGEYFTFETVMSHQAKIDSMRVATVDGYKCYLYFDVSYTFTGSFLGLLNTYSVGMGLLSLVMSTCQGANYMAMRAEGPLEQDMRSWATRSWGAWVVLYVLLTVATVFVSPYRFEGVFGNPLAWVLFLLMLAALVAMPLAFKAGHTGRAFLASPWRSRLRSVSWGSASSPGSCRR